MLTISNAKFKYFPPKKYLHNLLLCDCTLLERRNVRGNAKKITARTTIICTSTGYYKYYHDKICRTTFASFTSVSCKKRKISVKEIKYNTVNTMDNIINNGKK